MYLELGKEPKPGREMFCLSKDCFWETEQPVSGEMGVMEMEQSYQEPPPLPSQ